MINGNQALREKILSHGNVRMDIKNAYFKTRNSKGQSNAQRKNPVHKEKLDDLRYITYDVNT